MEAKHGHRPLIDLPLLPKAALTSEHARAGGPALYLFLFFFFAPVVVRIVCLMSPHLAVNKLSTCHLLFYLHRSHLSPCSEQCCEPLMCFIYLFCCFCCCNLLLYMLQCSLFNRLAVFDALFRLFLHSVFRWLQWTVVAVVVVGGLGVSL